MCGIIGYLGDKKALPFLLSGLKNLEYRGYDSCGVVLRENDGLRLVKTKGRVDQLIKKTRGLKSQSTLGLGHTRWATHGRPSTINAHPHFDCTGRLAVVHNGIIENYETLREGLIKKGHCFVSQTDTEVLPHLIEEKLKKKKDLFWAVNEALKEIIGAYGIGVIGADFPNQIIVARVSSPLVLGMGKKENFIASDQPALIGWTKQLGVLRNGQIAQVGKRGIKIKTLDGQSAFYQKIVIEKEMKAVAKDGFPHFMLKEIFEQKKVIKDGLRGRFDPQKGVKLGGIEGELGRFTKAKFLPIIACGTSYHAALIGKHYFQQLAKLPTLVEGATDLVGHDFPFKAGQPAIFVSQSGETADVLTALHQAKKKKASGFGLVNVAGSSLSRETKAGIYLRAGYEVGVGATKTYVAQILAFLLWSLLVAKSRKWLSWRSQKELFKGIKQLPKLIEAVLAKDKEVKKLALSLKDKQKIFILGRGLGWATALEGALKIKEIAYLPAEGLAAGELKHGPLALVDRQTVLIFLIPDGPDFKKNLNSFHEASVRGGRMIILTNKKDPCWQKMKTKVFFFPRCHPLLSAFPMTVWFQLLAYYLGYFLGCLIDKPRHLAKSVTVE